MMDNGVSCTVAGAAGIEASRRVASETIEVKFLITLLV
jgi:hypothetical protein